MALPAADKVDWGFEEDVVEAGLVEVVAAQVVTGMAAVAAEVSVVVAT